MTLWLKRDLPLICANPDRVVEHGDRLIYCGGALADLYEAHGRHDPHGRQALSPDL